MGDGDTRTFAVRAASADRTVTGTMSRDGDVTINLDAARVARLSAADLGAAATDVLRGLTTGFRKAAAATSGPPPGEAELDAAKRTPYGAALAEYYRELAAVELEVISPRGMVKAAWRSELPSVRVRPDSPPPPVWVLDAELNAAVTALLAEFTKRGRQIFRQHISLERFAEES